MYPIYTKNFVSNPGTVNSVSLHRPAIWHCLETQSSSVSKAKQNKTTYSALTKPEL